jgi:hypothetical protein
VPCGYQAPENWRGSCHSQPPGAALLEIYKESHGEGPEFMCQIFHHLRPSNPLIGSRFLSFCTNLHEYADFGGGGARSFVVRWRGHQKFTDTSEVPRAQVHLARIVPDGLRLLFQRVQPTYVTYQTGRMTRGAEASTNLRGIHM